jgi:hypothetical protein
MTRAELDAHARTHWLDLRAGCGGGGIAHTHRLQPPERGPCHGGRSFSRPQRPPGSTSGPLRGGTCRPAAGHTNQFGGVRAPNERLLIGAAHLRPGRIGARANCSGRARAHWQLKQVDLYRASAPTSGLSFCSRLEHPARERARRRLDMTSR